MAAHINIYEITPNIYEALQACADSEFYTFALLEPKADDSRERKRDIEKETAEVNDLINLDLLRDISYKYTTQIKDCQEEHGFGYKVLELTEAGLLMFANSEDRKVN
jgi:hypothetical protein